MNTPWPNVKISERRIALRVKPAAERALRNGRPWIFEESIMEQSHDGVPGDLAVIFDRRKGNFLAIGLYDPHSQIRVRVLQRGKAATIDQAWFSERIAFASALRAPLQNTSTTGYRLIHGENDYLPGLVVDRYGSTLVIKLYSLAWIPHLPNVLSGLAEVQPAEQIVLRLNRSMQEKPELLYGVRDGSLLLGDEPARPATFLENGLRFEADPIHGQKTGFFLDQRDNRARVETMSRNRRVLNLFSYTGGFSLYAARGGAREVVSVDSSAPALDAAKRNFELNQDDPRIAAAKHHGMVGDVFEVLADLKTRNERFDLVIIDPPAFAKKKAEMERACVSYSRLVEMGLAVLAKGGTLVMASCSSRIDEETFFDLIHRTASKVGRPLQELERTGHALDHPITFPEGAYLKALFARAE